MEDHNKKIDSPFQAPEGYFENFESQLMQRMQGAGSKSQPQEMPKLKVVRNTFPVWDYVAVAATIAAIAVSSWFVLTKNQSQTPTVAKAPVIQPAAPAPVEEAAPLPHHEVEELLVAAIYEDIAEATIAATETTSTPQTSSLTPKETKIAMELEDAGLIVLETNDGMFDPFEI